MDETVRELLEGVELGRPLGADELNAALGNDSDRLPADYSELLQSANGVEGAVGNSYIQLWSVDQILILNDQYSTQQFCPGLLLIGSDGGGTGYGFLEIGGTPWYVAAPLVGLSPDAITKLSQSLTGFVGALSAGIDL